MKYNRYEPIGVLNKDYFIKIATVDENGLKIFLYDRFNVLSDIVFDFGYIEDFRLSYEGIRFDKGMPGNDADWTVFKVEDSEYLKKLNKDTNGFLLTVNPNLKHFYFRDLDYIIDVITSNEPKVYVLNEE